MSWNIAKADLTSSLRTASTSVPLHVVKISARMLGSWMKEDGVLASTVVVSLDGNET